MSRAFAQSDRIVFVKSARQDAAADTASIEATVKRILADVRDKGDAAVRKYALEFDKSCPEIFEVSAAERQKALNQLDRQTREDTEFAIGNVRAFAEAQLATILPLEVETRPGLHLGHRVIPIERVGAYVPGGRYPLLSAPIMKMCIRDSLLRHHAGGVLWPELRTDVPGGGCSTLARHGPHCAGACLLYTSRCV